MSTEFVLGLVIGASILYSGLLSIFSGVIIGLYISKNGYNIDSIIEIINPYIDMIKNIYRNR